MAVNLHAPTALLPIAGVQLATAAAGIKKIDRQDVTLLVLDEGVSVAGVFTRNAFCAAPVVVAQQHLQQTQPRALIINTGNANAGTGTVGMAVAHSTCAAVAAHLGMSATQILPFSTGVIGEPKPLDEKIATVLPALQANLKADNWVAAAHAIMTTDSVAKGKSAQVTVDGKTISITGICKGAGMIRPDMATMLAYIATDAAITPSALQGLLQQMTDGSFNCVTVDGDTSTNDACMLMASHRAGNAPLHPQHTDWPAFSAALQDVFLTLAQAMVRDGEGATHLIEIAVTGAADAAEARRVADAVAHSPLFKTAAFANDPNWGRILAAVGRAGVSNFDIDAVTVHLNDVCIVEKGGRASSYTEAQGQAVMDLPEYAVRIHLARGKAAQTVWTCDFGYEYVKINAEYRT